ncbi:MAG: DUF2497 domain-containing protein [Alphaproteobacteria bacterium]|nr:DUF2497 domain-containing protein [Alphaproteobacteria bacterium]
MSGEPEEMSMNEVLSSIRQMLSDGDETGTEPLDSELEDIFVLTPAMRVPEASAINIQERMKAALNKLAEQKGTKSSNDYKDMVRAELRPIVKEWLAEQMPSLIDQAVENEINKLFG